MDAARWCVTNRDGWVKPFHIAQRAINTRNDRRERLAVGGGGRTGVPKPARFDEAVEAARKATAACVAVGHSCGSEITVKSAFGAAAAILGAS